MRFLTLPAPYFPAFNSLMDLLGEALSSRLFSYAHHVKDRTHVLISRINPCERIFKIRSIEHVLNPVTVFVFFRHR